MIPDDEENPDKIYYEPFTPVRQRRKRRQKTGATMPKKPAKKAAKVRKIMLPPDEVVRVIAPPGVAPVVMPVARNVIEIVPAKKKTWWQSVFG